MGLKEARAILTEHRLRQQDPFLWPDFLTGLPDRPAVIRKVREAHPKLGRLGIAYVRIGNIEPYLVKYGTKAHVEVIQWAAAGLKASADERKSFVGTLGNHNFVVISAATEMQGILEDADKTFQRAVAKFYSSEDIKNGYVLEFERDGKSVKLGLMRLIYASLTQRRRLSMEAVLPALEQLCTERESQVSAALF